MEQMVNMVSDWSTESVLCRLLIAMFAGVIVGIEREHRNRGAGIRTHVLVCIGSALTMIVGEYAYMHYPDASIDPTRLGAQVISGIGFLGAGMIIVIGRNEIRGLTTAAGLWVCAGIGITIGAGYLQGTLIALLLVLFTFLVLSRVDDHVRQHVGNCSVYLEFKNKDGIRNFLDYMHDMGVEIVNFDLKGEQTATASLTLPRGISQKELSEAIGRLESVSYKMDI